MIQIPEWSIPPFHQLKAMGEGKARPSVNQGNVNELGSPMLEEMNLMDG